jgi:NDP-sugar pyrophosphorylase family protein
MYEIVEEPQTATEKTDIKNIDCIVLLVGGENDQKLYDRALLGSTMYNWVVRACPTKPALAPYDGGDVLLAVKPLLKSGEYTIVLFSDTPLVTASGVNKMIDYASAHNLAVCRLARGFVFKTEYIKKAQAIYATTTYDIAEAELMQANTEEKIARATTILQARINRYHAENGVILTSPNNTYIECSVAIDTGAVIEPFVKLEGTTTIGACAKICSGATIIDSHIGDKAIVKAGSVVVSSGVQDSAIVGNNCTIINKSLVGEDCVVAAGTILDDTTTSSSVTIGASSSLLHTKLASKVQIGAGVKTYGTTISDVKIGSNAVVGNGCVIFDGVYLKADYNLPDGTMINRRK